MTKSKGAVLLCFFLLLTACGSTGREEPSSRPPRQTTSARPTQTAQVQPTQTAAGSDALRLAQTIVDSQSNKEEYVEQASALDPAALEICLQLYGLERDSLRDAGVLYAGGVSPYEVAVLCIKEGGVTAEQAGEALKAYIRGRIAAFTGYGPEQAAILKSAEVLISKDRMTLAMLVCKEMTPASRAFYNGVGGGAQPAPEPVYTPEPVRTPEPVYTPEPVRTPEPTHTPEPVRTPEPQPSTGPEFDENGWVVYHPAGQHDMTVYDTTAILAAWRSGDRTALLERDGAILSAAEAALAKALKPGMTDYEKELALHDWLVQTLSYDRDMFNDRERPDSLTPYGGLVEHSAACLGYATSFALLMDMAGIECRVVVGAAVNSTEDHAWNLVRLDGEWYAVDPTWDDPVTMSGGDYVPSWAVPQSAVAHKYFNVTSDYMRQTDHQWAYRQHPEANGTKYAWKR